MEAPMFILYVASQARSRDFYAAVLGAAPRLDVPGMTEFVLPGGQAILGLMPETGIARILCPVLPHPATGAGIPRAELYLYVEAPETLYARALAAGAVAVSAPAPRDWGDLAGYVADPDGHILVLAQRLP